MYSTIVCLILFIPATLLDVCFTIISGIIYIQTKLLQCYYREIVNIQVRLRDVQDPGDDDLLCLYSNLRWERGALSPWCQGILFLFF